MNGALNIESIGVVAGDVDQATATANREKLECVDVPALFFPPGRWHLDGIKLKGRKSLFGVDKHTTIVGGLTYDETDFPQVVGTLTQVTDQDNLFLSDGVSYDNPDGWGLTLASVYQPYFRHAHTVKNGMFYGKKGLLIRHLAGSNFNSLEFHSRDIGARNEGSNNISYNQCHWFNQRVSAIETGIALAGDQSRKGGERLNIRGGKMAGCVVGLKIILHQWLSVDDLMLDYTTLPLFLHGSPDAMVKQSYLGASGAPKDLFQNQPGYLAPSANGPAVYAAPRNHNGNVIPTGGLFESCQFVQYRASVNKPLVHLDKQNYAGAYPVSRAAFANCEFRANQNLDHSMPSLLRVHGGKNVHITNNRFYAAGDTDGSLQKWYDLVNCDPGSIVAEGNVGDGLQIPAPSFEST